MFYYSRLLTLFASYFTILHAGAQEIKNDTIYASLHQYTTLLFPAAISACDYTEEAAYTRFQKRIENSMVSLIARSKNAEPATMKITEGKRNHRFVVMYKHDLAPAELEHDWEDLKELTKYASSRPAIRNVVSTQPPLPAVNNKPIDSSAVVHVTGIHESNDYNALLLKGFLEFDKKQLQTARQYYTSAAALKPQEKIAHNKIIEIDKLLNEQKTVELTKLSAVENSKKYHVALARGEAFFQQGKVEEAQASYADALSFKPGDLTAQQKLRVCARAITDRKIHHEKLARQVTYDSLLSVGKQLYNEGKLYDSKVVYTNAITLKPNGKVAAEQLALINSSIHQAYKKDLQAKQAAQREDSFRKALSIGNDAYNSGNLKAAERGYLSALSYRKDAYSAHQLSEVKRLLADSIIKDKRARVEQKNALENQQKYALHTALADKLFAKKDYKAALNSYKLAGHYSEDPAIKNKIQLTSAAIKKSEDQKLLTKKYTIQMIQAKAAIRQNNLDQARVYLDSALLIIPGDTAAERQAKLVYKRLDFIRKEKEANDQYDSLMYKAAGAIQEPIVALEMYRQANAIKPSEKYPIKMITYLEANITDHEKKEYERKKSEHQLVLNTKRQQAITEGDRAILRQEWQKAREAYTTALTMDPDRVDATYATKKITDIDLQLARVAENTSVKDTSVLVAVTGRKRRGKKTPAVEKGASSDVVVKSSNLLLSEIPGLQPPTAFNSPRFESRTALQTEALPYTHEEMLSRYPGINFDELPPGQTMDTGGKKNRTQLLQTTKLASATPPRIYIADSSGLVKVTCRSISFFEGNAYFNLLTENAGDSDFLTGRLQLRLVNAKGTVMLNQVYISDFPVIMPKHRFSIVYVARVPSTISTSDEFVLELNDRGRQTTVAVHLPGKVLLEEQRAGDLTIVNAPDK